MKFSIITPTHNRPEQLLFCIESVATQDSFQVEHIIINDSPDYDYSTFENNKSIIEAINNKQIIYIKNKENKGKNYSCNLALTKITGDYVIFLDDDDWLAPDALNDIEKEISLLNNQHQNEHKIKWLVTNRCYGNKESLTKNKTNKKIADRLFKVNYFWDCMIFKRFSGDATHIIESDLARSAQFNKKVKNGKEWYYFAQLTSAFIYMDLNSTITNGYHDNGLSDQLQTKSKIQKLITTIYNLFIFMKLKYGKN